MSRPLIETIIAWRVVGLLVVWGLTSLADLSARAATSLRASSGDRSRLEQLYERSVQMRHARAQLFVGDTDVSLWQEEVARLLELSGWRVTVTPVAPAITAKPESDALFSVERLIVSMQGPMTSSADQLENVITLPGELKSLSIDHIPQDDQMHRIGFELIRFVRRLEVGSAE